MQIILRSFRLIAVAVATAAPPVSPIGSAATADTPAAATSNCDTAIAHAISRARPGTYPVRWLDLDITSFDGVSIRASAAMPSWTPSAPPPCLGFPLLLMPNSWAAPNGEYASQQLRWASAGYIVIEYDARGWYESGGKVGLGGAEDMKDMSAIIDTATGHADEWHLDPRAVGAVGVSYGGGLAVLGAAHDARISVAASLSGWGNITDSLYPYSAPSRAWADLLLSTGAIDGRLPPSLPWLWTQLRTHGDVAAVRRWGDVHSPVSYAGPMARRGVSLFISNNLEDRLFRPDAALAYRQAMAAAGVPTVLMLNQGIHGSAEMEPHPDEADSVFNKVLNWLDRHLKGAADADVLPPISIEPRQLGLFGRTLPYFAFDSWPPPLLSSATYALVGRGGAHFGGLRLLDATADTPATDAAASTATTSTTASIARTATTAFAAKEATASASAAAAASANSKAAAIAATTPSSGESDTISFGRMSGLSAGIPFLSAGEQVFIRHPISAELLLTNPRHSVVYLGAPLPANRTLCGLPNATLTLTPTEPSFQVVAYLYVVNPIGIGTLLAHGPRNVWSSDGPAPGVRTSLSVHMRAACVPLRAGHRLALGVDMFSSLYTPSGTDEALALRIHYAGASTLQLPWLEDDAVAGSTPRASRA